MALMAAKNISQLRLEIKTLGYQEATRLKERFNAVLKKEGIMLRDTAKKRLYFANTATKMQTSNKQVAATFNKLGVAAQRANRILNATRVHVGRLEHAFIKFRLIAVRVMHALTAFFLLYGLQRVITGFSKTIVSANAQLEMMGKQLLILYRNTEKVARVMAYLKEYAIVTPFVIQDLIRSTVTLRAFALEVERYTAAVGDWSAAIGRDVKDMAVAFGKIAIGTPRTAMLLATRGLTMAEFNIYLRKFHDRAEALNALTMAHFGGMAEGMARTFTGFLSNINDAWFLIAASIGEGLFQVIRGDVEAVHAWMRKILENKDEMKKFKAPIRDIYIYFRGWALHLATIAKLLGVLTLQLSKLKGISIALNTVLVFLMLSFGKSLLLAITKTKSLLLALKGISTFFLAHPWMLAISLVTVGVMKLIDAHRKQKEELNEIKRIYETIAELQEKGPQAQLEVQEKLLELINKQRKDIEYLVPLPALQQKRPGFGPSDRDIKNMEALAKAAGGIPEVMFKMAKTWEHLDSILFIIQNRTERRVATLKEEVALKERDLEQSAAMLYGIQRVTDILGYLRTLVRGGELGMDWGIQKEQAIAYAKEVEKFIKWYKTETNLTVDMVKERYALLIRGLEIKDDELAVAEAIFEWTKKLNKELKEQEKYIVNRFRYWKQYADKEIQSLDKLAKHYYDTYAWTTREYVKFLSYRLIQLRKYEAHKLSMTETEKKVAEESLVRQMEQLRGAQSLGDALSAIGQKMGRELEKWRETIANTLVKGITDFVTKIAEIPFEINKAREAIDEQLATERFRLEVLRGIRQEKTEEQRIVERIYELEEERANVVYAKIRAAAAALLKTAIKTVVQFVLKLVLAKTLTKEMGKQNKLEVVNVGLKLAALFAAKQELKMAEDRYAVERNIAILKAAVMAAMGNFVGAGIITAALAAIETQRLGEKKIPGGKEAEIGGAKQRGMDAWVNKPTWFLTGEAGPERVIVIPKSADVSRRKEAEINNAKQHDMDTWVNKPTWFLADVPNKKEAEIAGIKQHSRDTWVNKPTWFSTDILNRKEAEINNAKQRDTWINKPGGADVPSGEKAEIGGAKQHGMDTWITKPTWFLAGEAGPERVTVSPTGEEERPIIQIMGNVYNWEHFRDQVRLAGVEIEQLR